MTLTLDNWFVILIRFEIVFNREQLHRVVILETVVNNLSPN